MSITGKTPGREAAAASPLVVEVGNRLRRIREDQGLSLRMAAESSSGAVPKATLDTYERATRAITVVQLAKLARVYNVSVTDLLPIEHRRRDTSASRWRFDLSALDDGSCWEPDLAPVWWLTNAIRRARPPGSQRGATELTVREQDCTLMANMCGHTPPSLQQKLYRIGILISA